MNTFGILGLAVLLSSASLAMAQENPPSPGGSKEPPAISVFDLVARVHQQSGRQFVIDPRVSGSVVLSGLDLERVDYDALLVILRQQGLVAVSQKDMVRIMPDAEARQQPVATQDSGTAPHDEDLVTRLVQVRNACAAHMVPVLRPLMPQYAHMAAYPVTNTIILVDRADNVRRVADLIERLDQAAPGKLNCGSGSGKGS